MRSRPAPLARSRGRLTRLRTGWLVIVAVYGPAVAAWTIVLAVFGRLDEWGQLGWPLVVGMFFVPLVLAFPPRAPTRALTVRGVALLTCALGAFVGVQAAWRSDAARPLWIASALFAGVFTAGTATPAVLRIKRADP